MALPPKFAGHRFIAEGAVAPSGNNNTISGMHTVELYLDYLCPYSHKMFETVYSHVLPRLGSDIGNDKVQFIFRQQVQPWHPATTLCHEAALAVLALSPRQFWPFSAALFKESRSFYDVSTVNEPRNATYARLAKLAAASVGVDEEAMLAMLRIPETPSTKPGRVDGGLNVGNAVTDDLKVVIKMARLVGVHVSPTVIVNGVIENSISSSFTGDQWKEYLHKLVSA